MACFVIYFKMFMHFIYFIFFPSLNLFFETRVVEALWGHVTEVWQGKGCFVFYIMLFFVL